ncbi:unnamed protein product, partial [Mesorhabditis spiculigera]
MNPASFEYPTSSTSVSGTSELFSSTFAILSDTNPSYAEQQWTQEKLQSAYYYETPQTDAFSQLQAYDGTMDLRFDAYRTAALPTYDQYNPVVSLPVVAPQLNLSYLDQSLLRQPEPLHVYTHQQQAGTAFQPVHAHSINTLPVVPSPANSITQRPTSSTSNNSVSVTPPHHNNNNQSTPPQSESPPDTIPLNATEIEDDERVMCMACRGVYPSRRSLTGHIGRNEKCREIIGRNYLEQLATAGNAEGRASAVIPPPPGTESAKAGAIVNGTDGLSPICPYCDRFISHYKGNIRRHINQCGKTGGKRPKAQKDGKRKRSEESVNQDEWSSPEPHQMCGQMNMNIYEIPIPPVPEVMSPPLMMMTQAMEIVQPPPVMNPPPQLQLIPQVPQPPIQAPPPPQPAIQSVEVKPTAAAPLVVAGLKKENEIPDDPYLCPFCDFLTVYKGNMKRHMNTCHVNEPDCKDHKLDKMKASVLGVDPATLMEKINAHKANSTRGRRPKKKDGQGNGGNSQGGNQQQHQTLNTHLDQYQHHMYQMNSQYMGMHGMRMGGLLEYDELGCPADPYVYPTIPGLGHDPSDPLQATINHVVETHRPKDNDASEVWFTIFYATIISVAAFGSVFFGIIGVYGILKKRYDCVLVCFFFLIFALIGDVGGIASALMQRGPVYFNVTLEFIEAIEEGPTAALQCLDTRSYPPKNSKIEAPAAPPSAFESLQELIRQRTFLEFSQLSMFTAPRPAASGRRVSLETNGSVGGPVSVPPPVPSHCRPMHPPPINNRKSPIQAIKARRDLAWVVVVIQTIVIVALSLLFFTYVLHTTQTNVEDEAPSETNRTPLTMRKHPRNGHATGSWEDPLNKNELELQGNTIDDTTPGINSITSAERAGYKSAVVVSNDKRCSDIGNSILVRGGNAADAAIATLFCLGVTQPQASGLGGGLLGLFCEKAGRCTEINARETAPSSATKDMFVGNPKDSSEGYRSIAVPGELSGMWRIYERFGSRRVTWHDIVWPSVELARKGIRVGTELAAALTMKKRSLLEDEGMRALLVNPRTADLYKEGETMNRDRLAETLLQLAEAEDPTSIFYKEDMADQLIKEIRKGGAILTKLDLEDYETVLSPALCSTFHPTVSLCGPRPPSSFLITQLIVALVTALYPANFSDEDLKTVQFTHRLIEASKFAFAQKVALGDPAFTTNSDYMINIMLNSSYIDYLAKKIPESTKDFKYYGIPHVQKSDHGTSHVSIIDEFGNAIAISSSINTPFGSLRASKYGFIYNSQMDAFSTPNLPSEFGFPPAETNFIQPGKCPMSSLSPVVALNRQNGQAILSAGGVGGTRIVPAMASLLIRSLFFERPLAESAAQKIVFSQYIPDNAFFENGFDRDLLHDLAQRGHEVRALTDEKFATFGASRSAWGGFQTTNDPRSTDGGVAGY